MFMAFATSIVSRLNRKSKCGTALVEITRALVFLGLKSTNHSFAHSFNFDKSLFDITVSTGVR
jgi:hypothetical protein